MTVLLVEDDGLLRRSVATVLERHGHRVLVAACRFPKAVSSRIALICGFTA
ncbi:response regulator [Streptomyces bikiniensis]|uniref:Response regulator n=1 Tax=Streptomyces bikiniensis TaxID=1896 RepID=A0ABW8D0B2_STRBI